jgi:two-component system sensor histidine kinase ChiS
VPFAEDDLLVLYSDGIVEATNPEGEEFGIERLAEIVLSSDTSAEMLRARILDAVRVFTQGAITDDRTLLIIRREAAQAAMEPQSELTEAAA